MRTPAGTECRHYYEDFNRGRATQECRLIKANRRSLPWRPADCARCAVPGVVRANAGRELRLELAVVRRFGLWRQLRLEATCPKHDLRLATPADGCPRCAAEERGAAV